MDGESIDRFPCIRKKRWSWVEDTFVFVPKAWNGPRQETARHADVTWSRSSVVKTHCFHRWYPGICPGRRVQELDYRQRGVGAGFSGRLPRVSGIVLGFSSIPLPSPSPSPPLPSPRPCDPSIGTVGVKSWSWHVRCSIVLLWEKRREKFLPRLLFRRCLVSKCEFKVNRRTINWFWHELHNLSNVKLNRSFLRYLVHIVIGRVN